MPERVPATCDALNPPDPIDSARMALATQRMRGRFKSMPRDQLSNAPAATLQAIGEMRYREVEMLRSQVKTIAPLLSRHQLRPVSLHFETPLLTGNYTAWRDADMPPIKSGASYERSLELAARHGSRYIVFNYLTPEERLGPDFYRSLAEKLNSAAEKPKGQGCSSAITITISSSSRSLVADQSTFCSMT